MAESKDTKNHKKQDGFVDDLDLMLNLDESNEQQIGLIDDDDAIDRLLVGEAFSEEDTNNDVSELTDVDQLIAEGVGKDQGLSMDIDEFGDDTDDIFSDIQINPKAESWGDKNDINSGVDDEFEMDDKLDFPAPESVPEIDEFSDDASILPDIKADRGQIIDDLENMAEIDGFSDQPEQVGRGGADFLLADFDISTDENDDASSKATVVAEDALIDADEQDIELDTQDFATYSTGQTAKSEQFSDEVENTQTINHRAAPPEADKTLIEHGAALASLGAKINDLKKQQLQVKHEVQLKPDKEELTVLVDSLETLKTEQKKTKRNLDALFNKKPVSAYIANGIAIVALIVGVGLGFQGYVAKLQVTQLVEHINKMQEHAKAVPVADAAEKEMFQKQLDELALANTVMSNQVAELSKSLQAGNAEEPNGGLAKQLDELNNQDMQMGAAIEALQTKLTALEKGKVSPAKPPPKKTPVAQVNWVVNLVAFKQDWYAKRKAEEFAAKGVPAKVSKAVSKGETWYRLVVDGFNTQYEAAAYAARIKKTLNLDSVWVTKNKD